MLGSLAYDRRLRGDPYDPQRPSVLECGGCEERSTAPLHSRSFRGDELNYRSSTATVGSTTNLQHFHSKSGWSLNRKYFSPLISKRWETPAALAEFRSEVWRLDLNKIS